MTVPFVSQIQIQSDARPLMTNFDHKQPKSIDLYRKEENKRFPLFLLPFCLPSCLHLWVTQNDIHCNWLQKSLSLTLPVYKFQENFTVQCMLGVEDMLKNIFINEMRSLYFYTEDGTSPTGAARNVWCYFNKININSLVFNFSLLELFFALFRCKDKLLRQVLYSHIVTDIKNINAKHKNNKVNNVSIEIHQKNNYL